MTSRGRLACAALCLWALVIGPSSVEAGITTIRIDLTEPLPEGAAFGGAGAYERVTGVARGEVDPGDPRNAGIVNLDRAPRNARGCVEYETDFYLLRPVDPAKGNGKILFEVNNRGRKLLFPFLMDATTGGNDPRTRRGVTRSLVQMRFLLPEDAERFVEAARSRRPVTP